MNINEADFLFPKQAPSADDPHWSAEWLVTNALGGYASGTVAGLNTRRYHGYLIAALPAPHGRTVMLNEIYEEIEFADGRVHGTQSQQKPPGAWSSRIALSCSFSARAWPSCVDL